MREDSKVLLLGEDVGTKGGVFGASIGLQDEFGTHRVMDMPICEMAFTGMSVGLALEGYRPIVEVMFSDFFGVCLEQIYNAMAKIPYMTGGRVKMPIVVKTAAGCIGSGAQHSQALWGTMAHFPGIRVVAPSTPQTARALMKASIDCDDPVVFFEHKAMLKDPDLRAGWEQLQNEQDDDKVSLGKARITRSGCDMTIVTLSHGVDLAMKAADVAAKQDVDLEIIDLLSVVPLDWDAICASVRKTRRLLVVDEDYASFGLSGEIITGVVERLGMGALLQARRCANPNVPVPGALSLEPEIVPDADRIVKAVTTMMKEQA
jgi:pyruvate dehydrogenase E1 component beta subunit